MLISGNISNANETPKILFFFHSFKSIILLYVVLSLVNYAGGLEHQNAQMSICHAFESGLTQLPKVCPFSNLIKKVYR